jgi:beta-lactamase regulating signal transducer with metallopeptidase domain/HEAT repeat protein
MTIVESVGWVLLHFVWQGAVIALALAVLLALTPDGQARLRYAFSCGALTLMLITAGATAATVMIDALGAPPGGAADDGVAFGSVLRPGDGKPGGLAGDTARTPAFGIRPSLPAASSAAGAGKTSALAQPIVASAMLWLVLGWLGGVLALSIRLLGGWWSTRSLRLVGVSPAPDWCKAQLTALSARMRVTRPVAIVSSIRISVPVVLGHVKPVIVLPAAALSGLSPAQLDAILAHELAHVRRHDYLVNLAQAVIETLLFYHPAVWWVSRQVRETREHCCDDLAVTLCRSRREYVHALLDLEQLRDSTPVLALGATDGSLLARGRRLLAPPQQSASAPRLAASVIALIVVTAAVAGASFNSASVPTWLEPHQAPPSSAAAPAPSPTPQAAGATPVTMAPNATSPLASRWTWAEGAARSAGRGAYWIGYSISPVKTLPPFIYNDRSTRVFSTGMTFSGQVLSGDGRGLRFPGRPLAVPAGENHSVKVLFALDASRSEPTLTAVHTSTLSLPVDTKGLPVYWLGWADTAQSLDRIDRSYRSVSSSELKQDLITAAAVLDASSAVVDWLERRIASQDPDEVRGDAAERIAWHPITASVTALDRTARGDRSSRVRQEAAEALGDLAMPEAVPVLIALARTLPDRDARREAVEALGARREPAASDALASIARKDPDLDIQREAVETLGDFEDQRGIGALIELARTHPDVEVRRKAVETLGDAMPQERAVPMLKEFLGDRDPRVQEEALDTIAGIDDASGVETLMELARSHPNTSLRREAVEALADRASEQGAGKGNADQAVIELLSTLAATDRETDVQIEAIEALSEIGGAVAVAQLRKLATSHADERVRVEAIESLGEIDASRTETADFLKRLALAEKSQRVQSEALETLADLPDGAGIAALVDLARDHPSASTRQEALEQLLDSDHPDARALFERALKKTPDR